MSAIEEITSSSNSPSTMPSLGRSFSQRRVDELTDAFRRFDLDNDGLITKVELVSVLKQLGFALSDADIDSMMKEADVDGNGSIDLQEFMQINEAAQGLGTDDSEKLLREVFEVFDKDKNGLISAEELRDALSSLAPSGERVTVEECRQMIQHVDANGDGVVDFPEFRKMMTSPELLPCS